MGVRSGRARLVASAVLATAVAGAVVVATRASGAAPAAARLDRTTLARTLLAHHRDRFATAAFTQTLEQAAGVAPDAPPQVGERPAAAIPVRTAPLPRAGLPNVRVNDPAADQFEAEQTTQHDVSIAVSGRNVAVAFNDTQQLSVFETTGRNRSGYAYSHDGGQTFTDGGVVPNAPGLYNLGFPWVTSDRDGRMYYATLSQSALTFSSPVVVAHSDDGGQTWGDPAPINDQPLYGTDKEAITTGRDPKVASRDNVYATWNDILFPDSTGLGTLDGAAVATSADHGQTWSVHYADRIANDGNSCSFADYHGVQPFVDATDGTLYVAAEKFAIDDPNCDGGTATRTQVIFVSTDGGTTFGPGVTVAPVAGALDLHLGAGRDMRALADYPVLAAHGGVLQMAWHDATGGHDHIRFATSKDRGATWTLGWATSGGGDEVQPALSVDSGGIHLAYYRRNADNTLDTVVADSTDGARFTAQAITSQPFPAVLTMPSYDPQTRPADMGDYIANVTDGTHQYFAWADNRDKVVNFMAPRGRNDPDVFFARR